mgnify:CR=1 FL=1
MRVIIAGSRIITEPQKIETAILHANFRITEVVSGGAPGVDRLGEKWAHEHQIPVRRFIPKWDLYGKGAGMIRNKEMVQNADALIAIWDGNSPGTANMIQIAQQNRLSVFVLQEGCLTKEWREC